MIKRICLVPRGVPVPGPFAVPGIAGRLRLAVCTAIEGLLDHPAPYAGCVIEWFENEVALERAEPCGEAIVADEVVLRGADWLAARWARGGTAFKHMALARRARGLTPAEFSDRWRNRAGQITTAGGAATVAIPAEARGLAYAQNHPRPRAAGEWPYDAVNEVWFDDLDSMRTRIDWFRANLVVGADDDLVSESSFLAVREEVVTGEPLVR